MCFGVALSLTLTLTLTLTVTVSVTLTLPLAHLLCGEVGVAQLRGEEVAQVGRRVGLVDRMVRARGHRLEISWVGLGLGLGEGLELRLGLGLGLGLGRV